ncbi:recombinase family protein [Bacillus dakarensis]|uniref:recombinase family protein n=1 Tax=Robertmurraya dakarensis TaxID=1926278 RepID=UPI000980D948|nr:recombinase family protein [Bacillus dakarensis]
MNEVKYHVFFRRVSTPGQDIAMQVAADAPFREKLLPEEILVFEENAVSANKLSIQERPEMKKVISLIKQDKVHTIYAFDRTRLYRDSYEAQAFNDLRKKHNVQLLLTSTDNGNIQATEDIFLEGLLNIFSDIEGKNIARRTTEARRMYPPKKYGYFKNVETKQYTKDPNKQQQLEQFFVSLNEITTTEELAKFLPIYRKLFKRPNKKLIEMARDPFYAGYDLSRGNNKLRHVNPYISLETFNHIQETKGEIFDSYLEQVSTLKEQNSYVPICGYCKNPLNYKIDEINNQSFYSCSKKHKKVSVTSSEMADIVRMVLHEVITHFDSKSLLKQSFLKFGELRNELVSQLEVLENQLTSTMEKIVLNAGYTTNWKEHSEYQKIVLLKKEKENLLNLLYEKKTLLQENKEVVEAVKDYLHDYSDINPSFMYSMFINKLYIFHEEVAVEISKFDYLTDLETVLIYKGDATA